MRRLRADSWAVHIPPGLVHQPNPTGRLPKFQPLLLHHQLALLDRGFQAIYVFRLFSDKNVPFVVPMIRNQRIDRIEQEAWRNRVFVPNTPYSYWVLPEYVLAKDHSKETAVVQIVFFYEPDPKEPAKDVPFVFATNVGGLSPTRIVELAEHYRDRWGIETGYQKKERASGPHVQRELCDPVVLAALERGRVQRVDAASSLANSLRRFTARASTSPAVTRVSASARRSAGRVRIGGWLVGGSVGSRRAASTSDEGGWAVYERPPRSPYHPAPPLRPNRNARTPAYIRSSRRDSGPTDDGGVACRRNVHRLRSSFCHGRARNWHGLRRRMRKAQ